MTVEKRYPIEYCTAPPHPNPLPLQRGRGSKRKVAAGFSLCEPLVSRTRAQAEACGYIYVVCPKDF